MISFDDFKKVEMRIGKILSAEKIPETDKLLKLSVDFGQKTIRQTVLGSPQEVVEAVADTRQVVSGIAPYFEDISTLIGKKCLFATNLEPRKIKGFDSEAMIVAVANEEGGFSLLYPTDNTKEGALAR